MRDYKDAQQEMIDTMVMLGMRCKKEFFQRLPTEKRESWRGREIFYQQFTLD